MRWGIAGFGWVAADHMAPGIAAAGGIVTAVADPSPNARARAERAGFKTFQTTEAMLASGQCDLLYVATPNDAHLEPVKAAMAATIPVLCEKPMAVTLDQAEAIEAAVPENALYGTAFDQRHHPAHVAMAKAVKDGVIGRPVAVRIVYACWVGPSWSPDGDPHDNWRADPKRAGGGAVIDLALHGLDLSERLLGEPLVELSMSLQRRLHSYTVEDGGMLTGRTSAGVLFQSHVAYNCAEILPRRRLEILGEHGLLTATNTMGQTEGGTLVRRCGNSGAETAIAFDAQLSPFTAQASAFMAAAAGLPHDFSIARDLALMRLFDPVYQQALRCL